MFIRAQAQDTVRLTAKDTAQRGLRLMALNGRKFTGFIINQVPKAELGAAYGYGPESYRSGRRQVRKPKPAVSPAFARGIVPKHLLPKNAALVEQMT